MHARLSEIAPQKMTSHPANNHSTRHIACSLWPPCNDTDIDMLTLRGFRDMPLKSFLPICSDANGYWNAT